jgi:hypothetical protein
LGFVGVVDLGIMRQVAIQSVPALLHTLTHESEQITSVPPHDCARADSARTVIVAKSAKTPAEPANKYSAIRFITILLG